MSPVSDAGSYVPCIFHQGSIMEFVSDEYYREQRLTVCGPVRDV